MEALAEILTKLEHLELSLQAQNSVWLSVSDLVKYLGVSESTIRRLVSKNEIPYKRIGKNGCLTFNRRQIDLWLLSGEKHPTKRVRMIFQDLL